MYLNSDKLGRRSIRLRGWDYSSPGLYFITICTRNRECLFGEIAYGKMVLNAAGRIAEEYWQGIPRHFLHAALDEFVVMPNHLHGIIVITHSVADNHTPRRLDQPINVGSKNFSPLPNNPLPRSPSKTIGSVVRGFKIGVSGWFHKNTDMSAIWQRNYYEHIIRCEGELIKTRQYIQDNPSAWPEDEENPDRFGRGV